MVLFYYHILQNEDMIYEASRIAWLLCKNIVCRIRSCLRMFMRTCLTNTDSQAWSASKDLTKSIWLIYSKSDISNTYDRKMQPTQNVPKGFENKEKEVEGCAHMCNNELLEMMRHDGEAGKWRQTNLCVHALVHLSFACANTGSFGPNSFWACALWVYKLERAFHSERGGWY